MFATISSNGYSRGSDALKSSHDHAFGSYQGWKPGELDIHFIQTGCGEQTFFVFPDGTQKKFPLMTKRMVARRILDAVSRL